MGIIITQKGDLKKTEKLLKKSVGSNYINILEKYGQLGVERLREATPKDTGKTANSWSYEIEKRNDSISVIWKNNNINSYVNIAVILQYGHATRNGGYVRGIDYINPALRPIFEDMANAAWKEVTDV